MSASATPATSSVSPVPTLFLSHGAPTFALEGGALGNTLSALGTELLATHPLRAVVVVSAHWQTRDVAVTGALRPETMHDFGGFPAPLYALQYPASGDPALAGDIVELLVAAGFSARVDPQRGLDHGAWVPLWHLLPSAGLPVLQVSLPHRIDAAAAWALGEALAPLRHQGVLLLGSGSVTHNLYDLLPPGSEPLSYVGAFADWVATTVAQRDAAALRDWESRAPHAARAHPTTEHFLPLVVAMAAAGSSRAQRIDGGVEYGAVAMDAYAWGRRGT